MHSFRTPIVFGIAAVSNGIEIPPARPLSYVEEMALTRLRAEYGVFDKQIADLMREIKPCASRGWWDNESAGQSRANTGIVIRSREIEALAKAKKAEIEALESKSAPQKSDSPVDRKNEIIRGFAVVSKGEASGHSLYLDGVFLDSIVKAGNASPKGLKSRFGHPSMFGPDGLGSYLGNVKNLRRSGDVVRGDLHIAEVSHKSPRGDIGGYVMRLAETDPDMFGASIVFSRDGDAEDEFRRAHSAGGAFDSPDADNPNDYRHARLWALRACDIVDDPASNPRGMFSKNGAVNR